MQSRLWKFQKGIIREGEMILVIIIDGLNETTKPKNFVSPQWSEYGPIWKLKRAHHPPFHRPSIFPSYSQLSSQTPLFCLGDWFIQPSSLALVRRCTTNATSYTKITRSGNITIVPRAHGSLGFFLHLENLRRNCKRISLNYI